jgi:hypothetical protein
MSAIDAPVTVRPLRRASALVGIWRAVSHPIKTILTALGDDLRIEHSAAARYAGSCWCDSVERRLIDDLTNRHRMPV